MVYSPGEMIDSPQYIERGYFIEAEHPVKGKYTMPGAPFRLPDSPWAMKSGPVVIGTDTQEVLSSLGYDTKQLERLKSQGVI
jgi:crotonobetainyl-CoA:carnitine CoA-transferase CaiB-like acyl-CoA transferase